MVSPAAHPSIIAPSATNRAKVSNGSKLMAGVDGRSVPGRRFRDLALAFASDLGDPSKLTAAETVLVRQAAASVVASEVLQSKLLNGEDIDIGEVTRLGNVTTRLLTRLGTRRKPAPGPTLAEHLAKRAAERAAAGGGST
jgi:hypothetical protein